MARLKQYVAGDVTWLKEMESDDWRRQMRSIWSLASSLIMPSLASSCTFSWSKIAPYRDCNVLCYNEPYKLSLVPTRDDNSLSAIKLLEPQIHQESPFRIDAPCFLVQSMPWTVPLRLQFVPFSSISKPFPFLLPFHSLNVGNLPLVIKDTDNQNWRGQAFCIPV